MMLGASSGAGAALAVGDGDASCAKAGLPTATAKTHEAPETINFCTTCLTIPLPLVFAGHFFVLDDVQDMTVRHHNRHRCEKYSFSTMNYCIHTPAEAHYLPATPRSTLHRSVVELKDSAIKSNFHRRNLARKNGCGLQITLFRNSPRSAGMTHCLLPGSPLMQRPLLFDSPGKGGALR
jgi:hypothetical protein